MLNIFLHFTGKSLFALPQPLIFHVHVQVYVLSPKRHGVRKDILEYVLLTIRGHGVREGIDGTFDDLSLSLKKQSGKKRVLAVHSHLMAKALTF